MKLDILLFGGRGASSGISVKGHIYGTDYKTVFQSGNIKFVKKTSNDSESIMETMTNGRVYVYVNAKREPTTITYFDKNKKRSKQIDLQHRHDGKIPHTHHGYFHNENDSKKGYAHLTIEEKRMVEKVFKLWYDFNK